MTTKQEQLREHYSAITKAASAVWGSGSQARVKCIQQELDAIKKLLKPEPGSLAASVLRLTDLCNHLEAENHELKREQAEAGSNLDAAEKYVASLKQDLKTDEAYVVKLREELNVVIKSNVWLRGRLNFKDESLRACRAAEKVLKAEVARQDELLEEAEDHLCRADAHIEDLQEGIAQKEACLRERNELAYRRVWNKRR